MFFSCRVDVGNEEVQYVRIRHTPGGTKSWNNMQAIVCLHAGGETRFGNATCHRCPESVGRAAARVMRRGPDDRNFLGLANAQTNRPIHIIQKIVAYNKPRSGSAQ